MTLKVTNVGIVGVGSARPKIQIYPNPTTGQLTIKIVEIFDVVGQIVFTSSVSTFFPEITIDISRLANGMYFLKVGGKVVKIIKN